MTSKTFNTAFTRLPSDLVTAKKKTAMTRVIQVVASSQSTPMLLSVGQKVLPAQVHMFTSAISKPR